MVEQFLDLLTPSLDPSKRYTLAVVGGSKHEPEIEALISKGYSIEVDSYGIEDADFVLDLNTKSNLPSKIYDIVLCIQVIEHVWNHDNCFKHLKNLLGPEGYIWINCPASNRWHPSPDFFTAGFTSGYLENMLSNLDIEIVKAGSIGSKRNYYATHLLPWWLSRMNHKFIFSRPPGRTLMKTVALLIVYSPYLLLLLFASSKIDSKNPKFFTESWVLGRGQSCVLKTE